MPTKDTFLPKGLQLRRSSKHIGSFNEWQQGFQGGKSYDPEFLNGMMELVWPYASQYAAKVMADIVEPALTMALGQFGHLILFDRDNFSLGERTCKFNDVLISKRKQVAHEGTIENIVMRTDLEWDGDLSVSMKFSSHSVGLNQISIRGQLVVEYVALIPKPPMCEGVRLYFLNTPQVDVQFAGAMTTMLNQRIIRHRIMEVVLDQASKKLVAPNCFSLRMVPEVDIFRIKSPHPIGILFFTVSKCKNLPAMDASFFSKAKTSDPYIVLHCGAVSLKSDPVYKTINPEFDFEVALPILAVQQQRVRVVLYDQDNLTRDDFLGKVEFGVEEVVRWREGQDKEFELTDEAGAIGGNGSCFVSSKWRPLFLDADDANLDRNGDAYVFVGLYCANHLPVGKVDTKWWVTAVCTNQYNSWKCHEAQSTGKIQRRAEDDSSSSEEMQRLLKKMRTMQGYGMSKKDMANVLELDIDKLAELEAIQQKGGDDLACLEALRKQASGQTLHWNHGFEFLVQGCAQAEINFQLKSSDADSGAPERKVGAYSFPLARFARGGATSMLEVIDMDGCNVALKCVMQVRWLSKESDHTPDTSP